MTDAAALFAAVKSKDAAAAADLLARSPDLVDTRDENGLSPLMLAVYHRAADLVDLFRARGATVDVHEASATGDLSRLREWIEVDARLVESHSADGSTALHLACFFGHFGAVELLLDSGAQVEAWSANHLRNQALHAAIAGARDHRIIASLLEAGADVNAVGGGGYTPLHLAASRGDLPLIEDLLSHGASSRAAEDGRHPAEIASEHGHAAAAERLRLLGTEQSNEG